jgi:hypothetical protein
MTRALLDLLNCAWSTGTVVDDWVESIVVSLPKKGDLTDPGNYRGISLMSTCLKIACIILSRCINATAEDARRFSPSQAGFRRLEECITHAACLVEAIQQRRLAGKATFGLFIDLKKAYDMVPHEAVFAKMRRFGIRGRCYDFIVALYKRSTIRVRLGHGSGAAYTDPFDLERGVRQGCPLSCVLFNIFINALFDNMPYRKVSTPSIGHAVAYTPVLNPGFALLIRVRMGAIATVEVLLRMEKLPMVWNGRCPCCRAMVTEDIPHILLECSRYEHQREKFLSAMLCQLAEADPDDLFNRRQKSFMLLGGSVNGSCLPHWTPPLTTKDDLSVEELLVGSADLSDSSSDRSSLLDVEEHPTVETLLTPETGCLKVASFLLLVVRARNSYLRTVPDWPVSQEGQAFSAPGQRPNGYGSSCTEQARGCRWFSVDTSVF